MTLSYGTAYYGLGTDPVTFETARRALAEGNSLCATARIVEVDSDLVSCSPLGPRFITEVKGHYPL